MRLHSSCWVGVLVQWAAGASWGEIVPRPVVLAVMLWILRPLDPPGDVGPEAAGDGPTDEVTDE
ncbi:hypothetical protein AB0B45_50935 [Nonomuraea sp. NPDC049152]|uniref:hypothetical protein n=1 Tax=Nonomuraea sp. NPDC049152 TaxID=3154350 RepID=UPI0033E41994